MAATSKMTLADPVAGHIRKDFTRLDSNQTVGQALEWLRSHPSSSRIVYFYVVNRDDRLEGVISSRRLLMSPADQPLSELMERTVIALPATATVEEACEFFIQYRLLALPVVDDERRILGVIDIDLYTDELGRLTQSTPIRRWLLPLVQFLQIEASSGIVLLVCAVIAILLANSPWAEEVAGFWQTPIGLSIGGFQLRESLTHCINDGLMPLFFFVVGLEIKREVVSGELSDRRKAMLPVIAALGGMVVPALIYLVLQWGQASVVGWGIPMATDIAFVVGFLALLGSRVPSGLKILLLSLAIADDIGAALVIAVVYTGKLSLPILAAAIIGFGVIIFLRQIGVRHVAVYTLVGIAICIGFFAAGVHPTVAGAILGLLTPSRPRLGDRVPLDQVADMFRRLGGNQAGVNSEPRPEAFSPLELLERGLHPWVAFLIMPLFALANAGVKLKLAALTHPVATAVALGLILGKPIGIMLFSWASVRAGLTRLPQNINWRILLGGGCLAGIGFTMSLFIAGLALQGLQFDEAKAGILLGSTLSATIGFLFLSLVLPRRSGVS